MTSRHPVADLLPFYANGTLTDAERAQVEAELASCATCATELRAIAALGTTLRARADALPPVPARILDATLARLDSTPGRRFAERLSGNAWWTIPARYAIAAVLVLGFGGAAIAAYEAHEAALTPGATYVYRVPDTDRPATDNRMEEAVDLGVRSPEHAIMPAMAILARNATLVERRGLVLTADIPTARLNATITQLAALGTIRSRRFVRPATGLVARIRLSVVLEPMLNR
jgi:anti-sigma factor RsiW